MSASARIAATASRFGLARRGTACTRPASVRLLIAGIAIFAVLALPGIASAAEPAVTVEDASNVTATTADVEGTVDPKGELTEWRFEYVDDHYLSGPYEGFQPNSLTGASGHTEVSETLSEQITTLQPNTTYHLRLVGVNADGQSIAVAADTFTTPAAAPTVSTSDPEPVGAETAALDGVVDARNSPATYWFEWGTEDCEASTCESTTHAPAGFNEVQQINLPGGEEGEWTLSFEGQTSTDLTNNPTSLAIQNALVGLSTIGSGNVSVDGTSGSGEYLVTFKGALGATDVPQLIAGNGPNPLPGGVNIGTNLQGGYRTSPRHVTQSLTDLQPETTYHFQLVAESSFGTVKSPDREFTTTEVEPACPNPGMPGSNFLPDCRAYELVSPPSGKNGADVQAESHFTYSSASGNGLAYLTSAAFGDAQGTTASAQYLARRTGTPDTNGWASHNISPFVTAPYIIAIVNGNIPGFEAFTPELTEAIYRSWSTLPGDPDPKVSETTNLYRLGELDAADPSAQLATESNALIPADTSTKLTSHNAYIGASQDLSHIFFQSPWNLTTNGASGGEYFEYSDADGVRSIGHIPAGAATECDDLNGPACVAVNASPALGRGRYSQGTISADGSRVVFTANEGQLYLREDNNATYEVSASERTPAAELGPATFQAMSRDGSRVFFTTQKALVNSDEDPYSTDLYMYDLDQPAGHRLTLLSGTSTEAEAKSVIGTSADGHYVYFIASGQIVPGEPLGQRNGIYLWHDGDISFIGNLGDTGGDAAAEVNSPSSSYFEGLVLGELNSRVTPDGRTLLFMAEDSSSFAGRGGFSSYNHGGGNCGNNPIGEPTPIGAHGKCRELFAYRANTGRVICVSCNPEGSAATQEAYADVRFPQTITGRVAHESHALSDDGRYVFFTSGEALVSEDTNGNYDAYEYDLKTETVHLISSGTDPEGAEFVDASPDGRNAFFVTTQQLVGWDTDNNADVYDARVDGGFPEPVPVPTGCQGEACLPSSPPAPNSPSIASPAPKAGNPETPRHCPKGSKSVSKHGKSRCVKKAKAKHKRAKSNRRAGR